MSAEVDADDGRWRDALVAVDVGTSGARAAAFDLAGTRRLEVRRAYPTRSPRPGWAEQGANDWRRASVSALAELVGRLGPRRRVHAIGLTGQCPSVVVVDRNARPLRPGMIYRDNRASHEAAAIVERFGPAAIHARTGHEPAAFHVLPKLLWLARHEPDVFAAIRLVLQPRDWVGLALTGEAATDGTHAAATLLFDVRARRWSPDLAAAFGIDPAVLPQVRASTDVLGTLRPAVARRVGLDPSTPVVLGGADSQACALGAGVVTVGPVSEMAGSSTCLNAVVAEPLDVLAVTHYPHVVGGAYTTETGINTTGAAAAWLADLAYRTGRGHATGAAFEQLDREVAGIPAGADGVLALPVLGDGERTDPDLRAAVTGLSIRHGRAHLARAILEGVAFEIRSQLELLAEGGAPPTELRISGGDVRIGAWNRIKADVTGLPVVAIPGDAAVSGVAMLAGMGAAVYAGPKDAIAQCVHPGAAIEPDARCAEVYANAYRRWSALAGSAVVRSGGSVADGR